MKATLPVSPSRSRLAVKAAGAVFGIALASAVLVPGRMPAGTAEHPAATVSFHTVRTGQLGVQPAGELTTAELRPGASPASATFTLGNRTGRSVDLRIFAQTSGSELDEVLIVRCRVGDREVFAGPLGELRRVGTLPARLGPQAEREIVVEGWLPADATGYEYRDIRIDLQYRTSLRTA